MRSKSRRCCISQLIHTCPSTAKASASHRTRLVHQTQPINDQGWRKCGEITCSTANASIFTIVVDLRAGNEINSHSNQIRKPSSNSRSKAFWCTQSHCLSTFLRGPPNLQITCGRLPALRPWGIGLDKTKVGSIFRSLENGKE